MNENLRVVVERPPSFLTRFGTLLAVMSLTVLVALGFLIEYPEKTSANLILTTDPAPQSVIANRSGLIGAFFVEEGAVVQRDSVLAVFESDAHYEDVLALEQSVHRLQVMDRDSISADPLDRNWQLGELADDFSDLYRAIAGYSFTVANSDTQADTDAYQGLKGTLYRSIRDLRTKRNLVLSELETARQNFRAKQRAYTGSDSSLVNLTNAKQVELAKENELKEIELRIQDLQRDLRNFDLQILESQQGREAGSAATYIDIQRRLIAISKEIDTWKYAHLVRAPVAGKVAFYSAIAEQIIVSDNEPICAIVPALEDAEVVGHIQLPLEKSGNVEVGQEVKVRFSSYPSQEFGFVSGRIGEKSTLPSNNAFFIKVHFPQGLRTSLNKDLSFRMQLQGEATIITERRRLIHRVFSRFMALFRG